LQIECALLNAATLLDFSLTVPMSRKVLFAFAMLLALRLHAAEEWTPTRAFRIFSKTTDRGLPQSSIVALAQDADGLMWIGTLDGAATFDGRTITPVPQVAGAPARGLIPAIVTRKNGGVAIASPAGVHLFDGKSWRLVASHKPPNALAETSDGTLWMADNEGALWALRAHDTWERNRDAGHALALTAAADGSLWVATETGAEHMRGGKIEPVPGAPVTGRPGAILVAHDGRAWIATMSGTVYWTRGADGWHQAQFTPWPRSAFHAIAEDRRGRIWVGAYGGGVAFGNADMPWTVWSSPANGPFAAGVMSLLGDREGSVWFGENAVGLIQWLGEEWSHRAVLDPTQLGSVTYGAFQISKGATPNSLLVAAFEKGFLRCDASGCKDFNGSNGLTEDTRAVVEPSPGFLIAGTRFGIFESRDGKPFQQVVKMPAGFVMGIFESPDHRWYAATNTEGILVRTDTGWIPAADLNAHLVDLHVRGMTWRKNGELWVATLRGITIYRGTDAEQLTSKRIAALPDTVNAVLDVSDDEVWVAGTGGVAVRRGDTWKRMDENDGVPGSTVYSLGRTKDGAIWAGGSAGIGRFLQNKWKTWDSRSGLINDECNLGGMLVGDDGFVYVGSLGGLARFDPSVTTIQPPPMKLVWRTTPPRDANGVAQLPRGERALHLLWTAPWLGPRAVQYRTRIPGVRDAWSAPTSEEHLDIENVGAGRTRVEVEARVEGSDSWTPPLALDVDVPPFWYETPLARIAGIALLIAIIYLIVRLRMRALHQRAQALEATVRQRTAELAEKVEQLHDSEQRALAASRAKSAFLANMSHELRTPLNGVLGFAQLLNRRKERDADDREGLGIIMKSGEHLLNLINDVLSLSKIEAGRVTLDREPFDVVTLVHDVESVLRFRAEEKSLRLTCTIAGNPPRAVLGDEGKLRQILINLLGNAVKFTDRGSVSLCATWKEGRATFDVEDTGQGIAPAELPRLFEPFVQTESGHRTKEGTGLGLALSRDLARLMEGDITVESTPGVGSKFRVEISLPEAAAGALVIAKDRRRVARLAPGQDPARILVVDDTPLNRVVLMKLLASVGFEVRDAGSGDEALQVWETWQPHLIWMDKRMHGLDGLEVTRRIRAREKTERRKRVPILALSASALEHERGEIIDAGCDDFVPKPYRESTIFAKIREHLGVRYVYDDETPPISGEGRSVLLVDDDSICRQIAQELLRGHGISVTSATNGREALDLVSKQSFDLVLMDLRMPDMDGIEATRRIKALHGKDRIPIIAMSAEAADHEGMDDAISKPLEPEALDAALRRWLHA
jgi:signal transduction histidine kinase/CheY-like chemotaxis protein/ligand-binding sensor domain-containing protein